MCILQLVRVLKRAGLNVTIFFHPCTSNLVYFSRLLKASASSACMILFTSFTATTSFFVFGLLDPQYAPVCFGIGFIATYFGQIGLSILMKRAQRNSYIAFSIGGVVALSAILMTIQSVLSMAEGEHHKSGGICGKDS
jgi:uncharacterized membrane protein YfcA